MSAYTEIKKANADRIAGVPMFFAFSEEQFSEGLASLGCEVKDLYSIPGGGYIKKTDSHLLHEAIAENDAALAAFMATDEGMTSALEYELANYEFCITCDSSDALDALDLDINDEQVKRCLAKAKKAYMANVIW